MDSDKKTVSLSHSSGLRPSPRQGERWLLFDIGNVLVPFEPRRMSRALARGISHPEGQARIHDFLFGSESGGESRNRSLAQRRRGAAEYQLHDVWQELLQRGWLDLDYPAFREAACSIFEPLDERALSTMRSLKERGFRVALCSDTIHEHVEYLKGRYPALDELPEAEFFSFEVGFTKADPEFFRRIPPQTGSVPEHHLLIDDLSENLKTAEAIGMHTLRVKHRLQPEAVEEFLESHLW